MKQIKSTFLKSEISTLVKIGKKRQQSYVTWYYFLIWMGCIKHSSIFFIADYVGVWINSIFSPICYIHFSSYTKLATNNPHLLLATFLPVLLFESAFAMDVHTFYKMFIQVRIYLIIQKSESSICRVSINRRSKRDTFCLGCYHII